LQEQIFRKSIFRWFGYRLCRNSRSRRSNGYSIDSSSLIKAYFFS